MSARDHDPLLLAAHAAAARYGDDSVARGVLMQLAGHLGIDVSRDDAWGLLQAARNGRGPAMESGEGDGQAGPHLITLAEVEPERIEWIWAARMARGKLNIVAGEPGLGKSTVAMDILARLTAGTPLPDGEVPTTPETVLYVTDEDGIADTLRPRMEAAGADLDRVHTVVDGTLTVPDDVTVLEGYIADVGAGVAVLDPLSAFYSPEVNSWRNADVRRALRPVTKMTERTRCALTGIEHTTKDAKKAAIHRVQGSVGVIGATRVALAVGRDPDDESRCVLAPLKSNLAAPAPALAYRIVEVAPGVAGVEWLGESEHDAARIWSLPDTAEERGEVDRAADFLEAVLAEGPTPTKDVNREAEEMGLSTRTLRRARVRLGVLSERVGGVGREGQWMLRLPDQHPATELLGEGAR